ncbi:MAG TPA: DUF1059 domain-containing protein [Ktedonobacterales bacterium]
MQMEVTCRCGWITRGTKSGVIKAIQEHARTEHNLAVTPNEIRAIWREVEESPPDEARRERR